MAGLSAARLPVRASLLASGAAAAWRRDEDRGRGPGCAVGVGRTAEGALSTLRAQLQPREIKLAAVAPAGAPAAAKAAGGDLARGRGSAPGRPSPPRPGRAAGGCFPGGGAVLLLNPPAGGFSPFRARGGERRAARLAGLGLPTPSARSRRASPAPPCICCGRGKGCSGDIFTRLLASRRRAR